MEIDRRAFIAGLGGGRAATRGVFVATALASVLAAGYATAQQPAAPPAAAAAAAAVPAARFAGTWVGTQAWAISNPPPGSSQEQAVTLEIQVVDGKITGMMKPFLGGEDGATIVDAAIVGEELHATAVVGRPRPQVAGRRGGGAPGWKDPIRVDFVFKNAGVTMQGSADVQMGDVPWMKFTYDLGKKRARY